MKKTFRNFNPKQKGNVLREDLLERVPMRDVCDQIHATLFDNTG
jgi:hypothetical protein